MHSETDYIPAALAAMHAISSYKEQFLDEPTAVTTREIKDYIKKDFSILGFELDAEDLAPYPSETIPAWERDISNLNSNKDLVKNGMAWDIGYKDENGMRLTPYGVKLAIQHIKATGNTYKHKIIKLCDPTIIKIPSKKVPVSTGTPDMRYPDSPTIRKMVFDRANSHCEWCSKKLSPHVNGGRVFNLHHIYDINSTDENIISKIRYDHPDNTAALCGSCHDDIHQAVGGDVINRELSQKVQKLNKSFNDEVNSK